MTEIKEIYIPRRDGWHRFDFSHYRKVLKAKAIKLTTSLRQGITAMESENNFKRKNILSNAQ